MAKIAKIDVDDYFRDGDASLLKRESSINELLLQLTIIVNSIADRINGREKVVDSKAWEILQLMITTIEKEIK